MQPFISKKTKIKLIILAWYQILGGVLGVLTTIWTLAQVDPISGLILILILFAIGLYILSIYSGRLLLNNEYQTGIRLSIINQALQILSFSILGYRFFYVSGMSLQISIRTGHGLGLGFDYHGGSTWRIILNSEYHPFEIGIDFLAIYLVYFAEKLSATIKQEKINYDKKESARLPLSTLSD